MSKITIISIEEKATKTGVPFWSCIDALGLKMSIWDRDIAQSVSLNLNKACEASITTTPAGYTNLRAFNPDDSTGNIEVNPSERMAKTAYVAAKILQGKNQNLMSAKDISIVSQCMVKGAVELAKGNQETLHKALTDPEELGKFLCMATNELVGAYRIAVKTFEEGG